MAVYLGSNQIDAVMSPAGLPNIQTLAVSQNGTYSVSGSVIGYNPITVEVLPNIQSLSVSVSGTYSVSGSVAGYSPITVNVMPNIQSLTISQSGTYSISGSVEGFSPVTVNVPGGSLKTVQAYSGTGSIIYTYSDYSTILGYSSGIIFSGVTTQPNNFIIALTPQTYNYNDIDYGEAPWYIYNESDNTPRGAVVNIIYNGVSTQTYVPMALNYTLTDDIGWMYANDTPAMSLIIWSYNSALQTLNCNFNNNVPNVGSLCFPTVPPDTSYISYGVYPKPAYTLYYN